MSYVQETFDHAVEEYEEAKRIIEVLSDLIRTIKPDFSTEIAQKEFDHILQCILIHVAMSDGDFAPIESEFIKKITTYGDILAFVREKTGIDALNWDNIQLVGKDVQKQLMRVIETELDTYIDDFVRPFAVINAISVKNNYEDYHQRLGVQIIRIASDLSRIDGVHEDIEDDTAIRKTVNVFDSKWFAAQNKVDI